MQKAFFLFNLIEEKNDFLIDEKKESETERTDDRSIVS